MFKLTLVGRTEFDGHVLSVSPVKLARLSNNILESTALF